MVRIGLSITKSTSFRGANQEFSNVYYYEGYPDYPTQAQADNFIDDTVAKERPLHSSSVTFVKGRLWKQVGTKEQNEMITQKQLTGAGTGGTANTQMDKERAYLFRIRAGVDSRGNPVYLRKWFHVLLDLGGVSTGSGILQNTSGFSQAQRDTLASVMPPFKTLGPIGNQGNLCSKSGRPYGQGQEFTAHQFLEHHQLGDMWRAT